MKLVIEVSSRSQATKLLDHVWQDERFKNCRAKLDDSVLTDSDGRPVKWDVILEHVDPEHLLMAINFVRKHLPAYRELKAARDLVWRVKAGESVIIKKGVADKEYVRLREIFERAHAIVGRREAAKEG